MTVLSIDQLLLFWEKYLDTIERGTEIEKFLVKSLTVYMCGEYQNKIRDMIKQRAQRSGDNDLANFVASTSRTQRIDIKHLRKDLLEKFNSKSDFDHKTDYFMISGYSTIVDNRNSAAHGGNINMTFDELKQHHQSAKQVLDALRDALDRPMSVSNTSD